LLFVEVEGFVTGGDDHGNVRALGQRFVENDMTLLDSAVNDSHGAAARRFGTAPACACHTSCITCLLCDGSGAPATAATQSGGPVG